MAHPGAIVHAPGPRRRTARPGHATGASARPATSPKSASWTFLSNHAHVLVGIAGDPAVRMRDLASAVGITERAVQRIISELEEAGYLVRERAGRRNRYTVGTTHTLRHPLEAHCAVSDLLRLLVRRKRAAPER